MKYDIPDYVTDMDQDGKITEKDAALFHDLLDEETKPEPPRMRGDWIWKDFFRQYLILIVCVTPAGCLLKGTLPFNFFTGVLSIVGLAVGFVVLCSIIEML